MAPPPDRRSARLARVQERTARLLTSVGLFGAVVLVGSVALYLVGRGRWPISETIYMALNAVSTVGFRELEGMTEVRYAHLTTALVIVAGLGAVAYFQSNLTAVLVEGVIGERLRTRRMQNKVAKLEHHIIVAGAGATGMHVVEELFAARVPFVVIDRDRAVLERISRELTNGALVYVIGDATEDAVLLEAGIKRCRGVVAALTEDKDNLFVTLSARSLNATARIVAKVIGPDAAAKMTRAGANATVSPNMMGGRRLASEMVRPTVIEFLDQMLKHKEELRLEEVTIPDRSFFIGKTLREVPIRAETNLLVVALRFEGTFLYNPEPSSELEAGTVLVVLGAGRNVDRLRELVRLREAP